MKCPVVDDVVIARTFSSEDLTPKLVGVYLAAAAALKAYAIVTSGSVPLLPLRPVLTPVPIYVMGMVILGETSIGCGLLLAPRRIVFQHAGIWLLIVFIGYLLLGEAYRPDWGASCGCFGPLKMSIWSHVAINTAMLAGLLRVVRKASIRSESASTLPSKVG